MNPRLIPLIKQRGWVAGIQTWLHCRRHGHQWQSVNNGVYRPEKTIETPMGIVQIGQVKFRCANCHAVSLERLLVATLPNGKVRAQTASGIQINIIDDRDALNLE